MTLPTLDKTGGAAWQFNVNQDVGGYGVEHEDCADLLYRHLRLLVLCHGQFGARVTELVALATMISMIDGLPIVRTPSSSGRRQELTPG
jgi:hypothetical protein